MGAQTGAAARMRGNPQVTAPLTRCTCPECRSLDRLPVRRHGIPGAWQTTFALPATGSGPAIHSAAAATPAALPADRLPLFAGPLQPTLF